MHTIHHTEAFILRRVESGEANARVWLFTKELGLIVATVQGVRKPQAKLRSHLIDYTLVSADLVKGKDVWRLISVQVKHNPFVESYDSASARTYVRALALIERLSAEESIPHKDIFSHLEEVVNCISHSHPHQKLFDTVALWKIIVFLGYGEVTPELSSIFSQSLSTLSASPSVTKQIIVRATEALHHSQL